jgi:hypothetical protein
MVKEEEWKVYYLHPAGRQFRDGSRTYTQFEISNWGNVRKKSGKTGLYKPVIPKPCGGGGNISFLGLPSNRHKYVHRLVATYFVDNPHKHTFVYHKDGNHHNNHWTNLYWGPKNITRIKNHKIN